MRRHPEERNFYSTDDDAAEEFFRQAAKANGLSYHEWCQQNGVVDRAALTKIFRHEVPLNRALNRPDSVVHDQRTLRRTRGRTLNQPNAIWRTGDGARNYAIDPPFKPLTASDFHPPPESPARRLGKRRIDADAAE